MNLCPNTATQIDTLAEMHLQPEPLFSLPTDNVGMLDIQGTPEGRIFLAGKDGCLYEVIYQAEDGWFSRKCKKVNHSVSMLSFLVPSFLSFSEEGTCIYMLWIHTHIVKFCTFHESEQGLKLFNSTTHTCSSLGYMQ